MADRNEAAAADDATNNNQQEGSEESSTLPSAMRRRNRAVAQREAGRLARPERRTRSTALDHASKSKSAVASVPMGTFVRSSANREEGKIDGIHEESWCGPFSVARQYIEAREDARRKREEEQKKEDGASREHHPLDDVMNEVEMEKKRKANPSMNWRGSVSDDGTDNRNYYVKRRRQLARQREASGNTGRIPSLFKMCVDLIVDSFDDVEALGDVGADVRRSLCENLVATGKMNGAAFDVLAEAGVETLDCIDCTSITQEQLSEALDALIPAGLKALILNHAGRCFGPKAVNSIVSAPSSALFAVSIGGAYLLKDSDAASLIAATASTLSSIEFKACNLLGPSFCNAVAHHFASTGGNGCLLELSLEDVPLTEEGLLTIATSSDALRNLKSLTLRQIEGADDEVVSVLLGAIGDNLESIDLSHNLKLTDECLPAIRRCNNNGKLRSLQLGNLKNLTAAGLEAFFTHDIPGLPNPPVLRKLDLSSCDEGAVNDVVLNLAAIASSSKHGDDKEKRSAPATSSAAKRAKLTTSALGGLVHVDVSGSSVTDKSMEHLAATSYSSLEELNVSFCPHVSDKGLGYLVSQVDRQFSKLHLWGCAQITDEFLDGHSRIDEDPLEIVGIWMRQSGRRSVR